MNRGVIVIEVDIEDFADVAGAVHAGLKKYYELHARQPWLVHMGTQDVRNKVMSALRKGV